MLKEGPILIVDDDIDNHFLIQKVFQKLHFTHQVIFFENGKEALAYLLNVTEKPSLIFSDINMPVMDGLDFRAAINANDFLKSMGIPFIFLTTTARTVEVERAYQLSVQGFFDKGKTFEDLKNTLKLALEYWRNCLHPNSLVLG